MKEYHKINSVYKRDEKTKRFIIGEWARPEFEYLQNNIWVFTEKVDGTNIRVDWNPLAGELKFGGRTDAAQMPFVLIEKLQSIFTKEKMQECYSDVSMTLYGEGYGAKIQKGGGNYKADGVDFVLFDVLIGEYWLERDNVNDIASKLSLRTVPIIGTGTIHNAIEIVKSGTMLSRWGEFIAEGLVMRPKVELKCRNGSRIIAKVKHRDFN